MIGYVWSQVDISHRAVWVWGMTLGFILNETESYQ